MKPFQCADCSKRFKTDNGRVDHQRAVHCGEPFMGSLLKPYQCTLCPKRFATDNALKSHMRSKTKKHGKMTGNISCSYPFCKRRFQSRNGLTPRALKDHLENPGNWHKTKGVTNESPKNSSFSYSREEGKGPFDRARSSQEVNIFIRNELQPDEGFHGFYDDAIDSLYKGLQRVSKSTFYGIHNVIEGGSIAKGTALKNNSDLDCAMITKNIKDASQLRENLPVLLYDLKERLGSRVGVKWKLTFEEKTPFALQFNMSRSSNPKDTTKVDLLPTFEANVEGEKFYQEMLSDTKENWPYYSAALVKVQRDFVKERPASVKDLIRMLKYWRKKYIPQSGSKHVPPSYLLELLTIHAWENANRPESFDIRTGFKAVLGDLKNHRSLYVAWDRYYKTNLIPIRYIHGVF
ncbi:2 5 oligoadenylate synthetase [Porites harrisoni]